MAEQEKDEKEKDRKKVFAWWWLIIPFALLGGWFLFGKKGNTGSIVSPKADIRICTLERLENSTHCCPQDLPKISIFESNSVLHLSCNFPDLKDTSAVVTGNVLWDTGESFPTHPINLVLDSSFGESCYVAEIQPINGIQWKLRKYILKLQINGQPFTEKVFEMDR